MTTSFLSYLIIFLTVLLFILSYYTSKFWKDVIYYFINAMALLTASYSCYLQYGWQGWFYPAILYASIYLLFKCVLIYPILDLIFFIQDLIGNHKLNSKKKDHSNE